MKMTRKVTFSSGHRYWFDHLSDAENLKLFGPWGSRFNHGHNYVLDVEVEGSIQFENGMIVNIKDVDAVLKKHLLPQFLNRSINDEIEFFRTHTSCVENLLSYIWNEIERIGLPAECRLTCLKLEETPLFYGEFDGMKTTLTRVYEFAASHRLDAPTLSREENLRLYSKCNNPAGHGHNYVLEITISGNPDPVTGFICSLDELDAAVEKEILDRYDHKNLDVDVPELSGMITTSENVSQVIFRRLESAVPGVLERVRLHETARNIFEVSR
jgi:6-pyruvoyltetrahydropterin/6-carboxytetrahydropterin synthase